MSDEDDYRPKSPDLNFGQEGPPQQAQTQPYLSHPHQHYQQPPALRVNASAAQQPNWYQPQSDYSHSRSYSFSAQSPTGQAFNYSYQPLSATTPSYSATIESPRFPSYQQQQQQQQSPYHQAPQYQHQQQPYFSPPQGASTYDSTAWQSPYSPHQSLVKKEENDTPSSNTINTTHVKVKSEDDTGGLKDTPSKMPPRRSAAIAAAAAVAAEAADSVNEAAADSAAAAAAAPAGVVIEPSPVRTKFPTARIKRIMQADEEVGKVAQQTPIAVGKALELFMIQLVTKSAEVARAKSSKRVTPAMLKSVVEEDEQWDFLRDIVLKVEPDKEGGSAGGKGKAAKAESDSEEDSDVPKKKRGGGRRKKAA